MRLVAKQNRALTEAFAALDEADGPLATLDAARLLREAAEAAEAEAVRTARDQGISWTRIGRLYGLTKQGAQQRFRPKSKK